MAEETAMKSERDTDEQKMASHSWKRRGLIAAAWAAVVAIVARQTTEPVEAGVDGDVVLGASNTETAQTTIINSTPNRIALQLFAIAGDQGTGLESIAGAGGFGVTGYLEPFGGVPGGAGVYGQGNRADSFGVWGYSPTGVGVLGQSYRLSGVRGEIPDGADANAIAIYGLNKSSYAGPGPGAGGFGVYGVSAKGHGLVGATATAGGAAVVGATNGVAGAFAGAFYGPVLVGGAFTVFGPKSAAVPHPDGTHRRLYCVESPESWFEDFGEGQLACGEASITLDPDFAAVADLSKYHVFLTGYDDFELRVIERTPAGFRVQAKDDTSSGAFSWRVVAKRRDIPAPRFETVTVPHEPVLPSLPQAPVPPVPRASRRR